MAESPPKRRTTTRRTARRQRSAVRWSVTLNGLGKVKTAHVDFAPLTILVGKNNTGKSYVATLMWSLMAVQDWGTRGSTSGARQRVPSWFTQLIASAQQQINVRHELVAEQIEEARKVITDHVKSAEFLRTLFAFDVHVDDIDVRFSADLENVEIVVNYVTVERSATTWAVHEQPNGRRAIQFNVGLASDPELYLKQITPLLYEILVRCLLDRNYNGIRAEAMYIPAARTGLMLAYKQIVAGLFELVQPSSDKVVARSTFPLPTRRFLQSLNTASNVVPSWMGVVADNLEQEVLGGSLSIVDGDAGEVRYTPAGTVESLPLHMTSSMITELAPLLMLLRGGLSTSGLVFEEPEAHLHISAQRVMARTIAKLVNGGIPVVLTTHSDTFMQQINNLIKMSSHPERRRMMKEMDYHASELISSNLVKAYEFCSEKDGTNVREIDLDNEVFVVETLNDTLEDLARETIELEG